MTVAQLFDDFAIALGIAFLIWTLGLIVSLRKPPGAAAKPAGRPAERQGAGARLRKHAG